MFRLTAAGLGIVYFSQYRRWCGCPLRGLLLCSLPLGFDPAAGEGDGGGIFLQREGGPTALRVLTRIMARVRLGRVGDGRPRHCTMPAIAQRIDQQRENGRPLMARRVRQVVVRQRPALYVLVVVAEFRRECQERSAEIRMMEWVSWWASHRSSTLCRRRASSLR